MLLSYTGYGVLNCTPRDLDQFPDDFFTEEQRKQGAVLVHVAITLYILAALTIICDKYFVVSLERICSALNLQPDVAGATIFAAAGCTPELFTTVVGVFLTKTDVGLGTVVGTTVFNNLIIVAFCGLFSGMVIYLTWWPVLRDCLWCTLSVVVLIVVIYDGEVRWYEAAAMLLVYVIYIITMYFNQKLGHFFTHKVNQCRRGANDEPSESVHCTADERTPLLGKSSQKTEGIDKSIIKNLKENGTNIIQKPEKKDTKFNQTTEENSLYMAIDSETPLLGESSQKTEEKDTSMIKNLKENGTNIIQKPEEKYTKLNQTTEENSLYMAIDSKTPLLGESSQKTEEKDTSIIKNLRANGTNIIQKSEEKETKLNQITEEKSVYVGLDSHNNLTEENVEVHSQREWNREKEEYESPWTFPRTWIRRIAWLLTLPITALYFCTIPDCRRPGCWRKTYVITFLMSIVLITGESYVLLWMVTIIGETISIPDSVKGLTLLAACTSIPDLIACIMVARDGFGDMAVSNAIAGNAFDILVCLGFPWLLHCTTNQDGIVMINSRGLTYSSLAVISTVAFLFLMFLFSRWKLNKKLGFICILFYAIVITLSSLFELNVFGELNPPPCPD